VLLIHGQVLGYAVNLPRTGVDYPDPKPLAPQDLEEAQMGRRVDLQVTLGRHHAVDVADLARQIEDDIAPRENLPELLSLPDVPRNQFNPVRDGRKIMGIGPAARARRVYDDHPGAEFDQPDRQVAPDEA
jgi:hypothetical protein